MTRALKISADLSLPLDALTQTIAILAKRRAGKSYTMRRLVEQLFKAGQQVVIVDPKGDQWGIRSAADGKAPGLAVTILGGERGDLPLVPTGGEVVAKLVVEERVSVLLDVSLFRKHEVATFMTAFLENLYRLKAREIYRTPMMLVIDEADAIAPQKPQKGEERMLGAAEDIVRRGGQRGIGCVLVTQRSAVLNKNVLTQAQMLVALRTIAPQDLAAMDAWIQVHGEPGQRKTLMESLPSLPIGDAWFWSPGWPTVEGIFQRVHVLPIETFDSGATPKPGEKRIEPKQAAAVDLEALKRQMAATIEKAKAEDPKELRKRIAELERQVKAKVPVSALRKAETKVIEKPVLKDGHIARLEKALERFGPRVQEIVDGLREIRTAMEVVARSGQGITTRQLPVSRPQVREQNRQSQAKVQRPAASMPTDGLTGPEQRILDQLAELEAIGVPQPEKPQLAFMCGYTNPKSGGFTEPLGRVIDLGYAVSPRPGVVAFTDAGRNVAQPVETPSTAEDVQDRILRRLDGPQARLLRQLLSVYPEEIAKPELAERCGYTNPKSGGFTEPLGKLIMLTLAESDRPGWVKASGLLFLEGAAR